MGHQVSFVTTKSFKPPFFILIFFGKSKNIGYISTTVFFRNHPHIICLTKLHFTVPTFWSVDLVAAYRHQVDALVVDVDGNLPDGLGSVRVEEYLVSPTQSPYLPDRLLHPDLVVHRHDRDENGVGSDRFFENLRGVQAGVSFLGNSEYTFQLKHDY